MEALLDTLWHHIVIAVQYAKSFLDMVFVPLNALGPAFAISAIALLTVLITKFLSKRFQTKRYKELQKQFVYWFNIRREALKGEDPDKAKRLAKNIDQAKLNKLYYDYFFEGFLNSLATKYLPIFTLLAYVNEAYRPVNLSQRFGRNYVFKFGKANGAAVTIGAVFWFVLSLLMIYVGWYFARRILARHRTPPPAPEA